MLTCEPWPATNLSIHTRGEIKEHSGCHAGSHEFSIFGDFRILCGIAEGTKDFIRPMIVSH